MKGVKPLLLRLFLEMVAADIGVRTLSDDIRAVETLSSRLNPHAIAKVLASAM